MVLGGGKVWLIEGFAAGKMGGKSPFPPAISPLPPPPSRSPLSPNGDRKEQVVLHPQRQPSFPQREDEKVPLFPETPSTPSDTRERYSTRRKGNLVEERIGITTPPPRRPPFPAAPSPLVFPVAPPSPPPPPVPSSVDTLLY